MYVGHIGRGLLWNLGFVAAIVAVVAVVTTWRVFPLLPLVVLAVAWLVFSWISASSVRATIEREGRELALESYNHWTVYSAVGLLTYALPLAAVFVFTQQFLWTVETIETGAMYPNLLPGDTVLVERRTFDDRSPERGEVVAFERSPSTWNILRTAARPGDHVRVEGYTFYLEGRQRPQTRLDDASLKGTSPSIPIGPFELMLERNQNRQYVVSVVPAARFSTGFDSRTLGDEQFYLLADNRSQRTDDLSARQPIRDSRDFGPVGSKAMRGKPLYVAWSASSKQGIRWERIGLRLR
jgi:signal peptidase I